MLLASPSCVWCPPSVCVVVQLNGGVRCVCCPPCSNWVLPFILSLSLYVVFASLPFVCCRVCCGGEVRWVWWVRWWNCVPLCPSLLSLCLLSQHCLFRVVSLWNSGDSLCWAEGRVGVYCLLLTLHVLWCACCGLWNSGGAVCCLVACPLSSFCLPFLLPLCVGVRGSARAALRARTLSPNTIVFPCCVLFSSAPRLSSLLLVPRLFSVGMAVGVTMFRSVVLA